VLNILFIFRIFNNLRLPWKQFRLKCFIVLNIFLPLTIFEQLCACPEKQSCQGIFHSIEYTFYIQDFWATCAWPEEQSVPWKFSPYGIYFSPFRILEQLALALKKQSCPEIFHCIEIYFIIQDFWAIRDYPEKQSCPGIFHCIKCALLSFRSYEKLALTLKNRVCPQLTVLNTYFLLFRIFQQLALALKNTVALKIFTVLNMYFSSFRNFEQRALDLKNRVALEFFTCIGRIFIIQDFWATCACPENRVCPENVHCIEYTFYIQKLWAICACPEKTKGALNLSYCICIFYYSGFLSNLRLPWKTQLPWKFSLYWICIFYHSGILSNLPWKTELSWHFSPVLKYFLSFRILAISACPENRVCLEIFQARGAAAPSDPPPRTPMIMMKAAFSRVVANAPLHNLQRDFCTKAAVRSGNASYL